MKREPKGYCSPSRKDQATCGMRSPLQCRWHADAAMKKLSKIQREEIERQWSAVRDD